MTKALCFLLALLLLVVAVFGFLMIIDVSDDDNALAPAPLVAKDSLGNPQEENILLQPRLVMVTDTHIKGNAKENSVVEDRAKELGASLTSNQNVLVILGDVTDGGNRRQVEEAFRIISTMKGAARLVVVPGNHDYKAWGILPLNESKQTRFRMMLQALGAENEIYKNNHLQAVTINARYAMIAIDTAAIGILARGGVSDKDLEELEILLRDFEKKSVTVIIAMHHDPMDNGFSTGFVNAMAFKELVKKYSKTVEKVLYGHTHERAQQIIDNTEYVCIANFQTTQGTYYQVFDM